ncbi:hypothetical protein PG985_008078 [Apiospora marii]|uniref:AA1-like domain-containing protein n=1 Tax=Apiospora marii TaxID=335849 RepID=A0ABR1R9K5_9PEZI
MKSITGTIFPLAVAGALASPVAPVAARPPIEQLIVSDFLRDSRSGKAVVSFSLLEHSITCLSSELGTIPSERFTCTDPAYTFSVLESPSENRWTMEIQHTLEDG